MELETYQVFCKFALQWIKGKIRIISENQNIDNIVDFSWLEKKTDEEIIIGTKLGIFLHGLLNVYENLKVYKTNNDFFYFEL